MLLNAQSIISNSSLFVVHLPSRLSHCPPNRCKPLLTGQSGIEPVKCRPAVRYMDSFRTPSVDNSCNGEGARVFRRTLAPLSNWLEVRVLELHARYL